MKFEFRLTLKDFQEASRLHNNKFIVICNVCIAFYVLLALLRFAITVMIKVDVPTINIFLSTLAPDILYCISLYLGARIGQYFFIQKAWESQPHWKYDFCVEIIEKGLLICSYGAESKIQWSIFTHYRETKNLFMVYQSKNCFNLFPKRAFNNEEEINKFRELLLQNIQPIK